MVGRRQDKAGGIIQGQGVSTGPWPGLALGSVGPQGLRRGARLGPCTLRSLSHGVSWAHPHPAPLSLCL